MNIELICVGTELLSDKINTHIAYVGERLVSIGLQLKIATTVSDEFEDMVNVFATIFKRADIVLVTGGLGPTFDDLTREAVSKVLQEKLVLDRKALEQLARFFAGRNIEMPKDNEKQAYLINGAAFIENKFGTAPGQIIELKNKAFKARTIILLPGPKKELLPMLEHDVLPLLKRQYETKIIRSKVVHVYGLGESKVNEIIKPVTEGERKFEGSSVSFTILAHMSMVDLKVTATGQNELILDEIIHNISTELRQLLGDNIYGEGEQTLAGIVAELLVRNKKTLSLAESCTGGLISDKITNIPGSSAFFRESVVVYSDSSKTDLLKVPADIIKKHGAVSEEVALKMAEGVKELSKSDFAVSVTGIAGPSGGTKEKPVGTVCFAISAPSSSRSFTQNFMGGRSEIKERSALFALNILRKELLLLKP